MFAGKNNNKKSKDAFLTFLIVMVLVVASANATTITQTQIQTFSGIPNMSPVLTFDQFDDTGGLTLISIEIIFGMDITGGQISLDNDGANSAAGTLSLSATGAISSSDVWLLNASSLDIPMDLSTTTGTAFNLAADNGDGLGVYDFTGPDGMIYVGTATNDTSSDFVGSAYYDFAGRSYIGTGAFDITADIMSFYAYGAIGGIEVGITPVSASGDVEIIYTYTPEPATLSLMAFGSMVLIRKRRRK
ncbi:MAG: PEP-CTERM sorting domain-containing protein [Planctomycetes bacterium]|nr:PEP-CTERM sorting domain-containing protein [Planctomycetota bacterium]